MRSVRARGGVGCGSAYPMVRPTGSMMVGDTSAIGDGWGFLLIQGYFLGSQLVVGREVWSSTRDTQGTSCAFFSPPYQAEDLSETGMRNRDAVLHTPAHPLRDMLKGKQKKEGKKYGPSEEYWNVNVLGRCHRGWKSLSHCGMFSFFPRFSFLLSLSFPVYPSCQNINMT